MSVMSVGTQGILEVFYTEYLLFKSHIQMNFFQNAYSGH